MNNSTPISTNDDQYQRTTSPFRFPKNEQREGPANRLSNHRTQKTQLSEDPHPVEQLSRLSIGRKTTKGSVRESTYIMNREFNKTMETNGDMQTQLKKNMKKSRWICSVPLILLPKIISICQSLLLTSKITTAQMKQAQSALESCISKIFLDLISPPDEAMQGDQDDQIEFEAQCKQRFKLFIAKKVKRDLGLSDLQKQIKEIENECKILEWQVPTENMKHIHALKLKDIKGQCDMLKTEEKMCLDFAKKLYAPTEQNPLFIEFKEYFNGVYYGGVESEQDEISIMVIEKAEKICKACFQFSPMILCSVDEFSKQIDIDYLEEFSSMNHSESGMQVEVVMNSVSKSLLEKNVKNLERELKQWNQISKTLQSAANELKQESKGCRQKLSNIDDYSAHRQERKKAQEYIDIWHACKEGSLSDIKKQYENLKGCKFDINAPRELFGLTLLHCAVERKVPDIFEFFLKNQANLFVLNTTAIEETPFFYTPFHLAVALCNKQMFDMCFVNYSSSLFNYFTSSIDSGKINMPTVSEGKNYTALHFVVCPKLLFPNPSEGHIKDWRTNASTMLKTLLSKGASTCTSGCRPLLPFAIAQLALSFAEEERRQKQKTQFATGDAQADIQTLLALIDIILKQSLSKEELEQGCSALVNACKPQKNGDESIALFRKVLAFTYFGTQDGKKFITNVYKNTTNDFLRDCMRKYILLDIDLSALSSPRTQQLSPRVQSNSPKKEGSVSPRMSSGPIASPRLGDDGGDGTEKKISPRPRIQSTPSDFYPKNTTPIPLPQITITQNMVPRSIPKRAPLGRSFTESNNTNSSNL